MNIAFRSILAGLALLAVLVCGFARPAAARPGAYLYDMIKTEPYRGAWIKMLAKERDVPNWVKDFLSTGEGVNTPSQLVPVGVKAYPFATLCKAHDCGGNMLYVLFAPDGSQAYARLVVAGKPVRLLGKPDAPIQAALAAAEAAR